MITSQVILKKGREKSVLNKHPWIFSGAVSRVEGNPQNGDVVDVWNSRARFVARGIYNEKSQIRVRLLTWTPNDPIDDSFWRRRISRAVVGRLALKQMATHWQFVIAERNPGLRLKVDLAPNCQKRKLSQEVRLRVGHQ